MGEKLNLRRITLEEKAAHLGGVLGNFFILLGLTGLEVSQFETVNSAFHATFTSLLPAVAGLQSGSEAFSAAKKSWNLDRKETFLVAVMEGVGAFLANRGVSMAVAGHLINNPEMRGVGLASFFGGAGLFLAGEKLRQDGYLFRLNTASKGE